MGIPGFYTYIANKYKDAFLNFEEFKKEMKNNSIDTLYIDANGIIYESAEYLEEINGIDIDEKEMDGMIIEEVIKRLNEMIEKVEPKDYYIAFDGKAPLAKRMQQLQRRKRRDEMMIILGKKEWDRKKISVGTYFMAELDDRIKGVYGEKVSVSEEDGEGEHKIMAKVRERKDKVVMVNSKDSDIIILSLLNEKNGVKWICRGFEYIKVSVIIKDILDVEKYVRRSLLIGNDFLPRLLGLTIESIEKEEMEVKEEKLKYYENEEEIYNENGRELYIRIGTLGWKERYNKVANPSIEEYRDMVEWVYEYYTTGKTTEKEYNKGAPIYTEYISKTHTPYPPRQTPHLHDPIDLYKRKELWYLMKDLHKK